jgi:hypothetical protein
LNSDDDESEPENTTPLIPPARREEEEEEVSHEDEEIVVPDDLNLRNENLPAVQDLIVRCFHSLVKHNEVVKNAYNNQIVKFRRGRETRREKQHQAVKD